MKRMSTKSTELGVNVDEKISIFNFYAVLAAICEQWAGILTDGKIVNAAYTVSVFWQETK